MKQKSKTETDHTTIRSRLTGVVVVPNPFKPERSETILCGPSGDALAPIEVTAEHGLYTYEVDDLTDAVVGLGGPRVTLADSRENVATILAALDSGRNGGSPAEVAR